MEKLKIDLQGEFSATELEEIISDLAKARSGMSPDVPRFPPDIDSDKEIIVHEDALFSIRNLANGGVRVWLRSEGFGWVTFNLSAKDREGLSNFLLKQIGHSQTFH